MYKILHFSGGVYKFDLLKEHVEDVGGLLIQEMDLEESLKNNLINSLGIYNILCKAGDWINPDSIMETNEYNLNNESTIEYNRSLDEFSGHDDDNQVPSNLEKCLDIMLSLNLIEKRDNKGKSEYRILKDENNP